MKITTLNLQGFVDWQQRQESIITYLKQTRPDIILFQEVVFLPEVSPFDQVSLLNQSLSYPYEHNVISRLQVGRDYPVYREGLACLSALPVRATDTIALKHDPRDSHNRIIQLIDVIYEGSITKIANIHFSLTDRIDFATAHLSETLDVLKARHEERIIAGDFNIENLERLAHLWQDSYTVSSSIPYISYPAENKSIDYVLIPKSWQFNKVTTSGDGLSDHRALTVDIATSQTQSPAFHE